MQAREQRHQVQWSASWALAGTAGKSTVLDVTSRGAFLRIPAAHQHMDINGAIHMRLELPDHTRHIVDASVRWIGKKYGTTGVGVEFAEAQAWIRNIIAQQKPAPARPLWTRNPDIRRLSPGQMLTLDFSRTFPPEHVRFAGRRQWP